jgi:hypothetical protein
LHWTFSPTKMFHLKCSCSHVCFGWNSSACSAPCTSWLVRALSPSPQFNPLFF